MGCPMRSISTLLYWYRTVPVRMSKQTLLYRQRKGSFQESRADWRPAVRSLDLHWQALCSSMSSSPSRSPAQAAAMKCHWRKVPNGFYLGWLHLAPPYVRFCCMSCWHFDLPLTLWAGQPDVVLRAKSVWDLERFTTMKWFIQAPPQYPDCSSLSSRAGPSRTCSGLVAGSIISCKTLGVVTSSKGALATLCRVSP